ncbi:MAG TPA: sigma 54-interacting transcriptional regulator [Gemmatimonadales bacterium]|nr:sigma 54-interacting transcriptional regulator [Gemmatimonadales bacterium]
MTEPDARTLGVSGPTFRVLHGSRASARGRASFGPVADIIGRVADTEVPILLRGERGTGKALVARAIHDASSRRDNPLVKIDCAAPSSLVEVEMFGCERGAGPVRPGRLEFAHNGTLFLDHVSELAPPLQFRLQRALEEGGFSRPGTHEPIRVDVRLITASERDLERLVADGLYLDSLFVRLNVVCLMLPPLRQRRGELRALTEFFLDQYALHYNKPAITLSAETLRLFEEYAWPRNLQQLEAIINRLVTLGSDATVRQELLATEHERKPIDDGRRARVVAEPSVPAGADDPGVLAAAAGSKVPLKEIARQAADGAERELIFRTLQQTRWNRREAAQMLGVSYKALLYKIKRAELESAP